MSHPVDEMKPETVWRYFDEIRRIPHGSGNEKALGEAVLSWARERGCEAERDDIGNVVVRVKASPGREGAPTVVIQGHLDMVCEKNADKSFDFEKDPISLVSDGDWITADGTTLGADNGIGVAMALAFMDVEDAVHGPLELLFTVDEETGLNGARGLGDGFVAGRMLLNLDSEEDAVFYVGCAGGQDADVFLPISREDADAGAATLEVTVGGLRGGHSGLDIIDNRGNATRLLARALDAASREVEIRLAILEGGDKHNAIPREARATVQVEKGGEGRFREILAAMAEGFESEFASNEPGLSLDVAPADAPERVLSGDSTREALCLLLALPHGVTAMSRDIPGLVETSTNMARVRTGEEEVSVLTSSRSSVTSALEGLVAQIRAVGELAGGRVEPHEGYPAWQPDMESALLARAKKVWTDVHGAEPRLTAIHAGLECGIIGERYPGMDMVSIGPTIENAHSPDERVSISSTERLWAFVRAFVASLAEG